MKRMLVRVLHSVGECGDASAITAEAAALASGLIDLDESNVAAHVAAAECLVLDSQFAEARLSLQETIAKWPCPV